MREENIPVFLSPSKSTFWVDTLAIALTFFAFFPKLFQTDIFDKDATNLLLSLTVIMDTYALLTFRHRKDVYHNAYQHYLLNSGQTIVECFLPTEYNANDGNTYNLRSDSHRAKHFRRSKRLSKIIDG